MNRTHGLGTKTLGDHEAPQRAGAKHMSESAGKIHLGENHRLAASVVFRGTERACDSTIEWLEKPSSLMNELRDDVTLAEQMQLRKLAAALKEEVHRLASKVELDRSHTSRKRAIAAILSAALIDLQETQDSQLKGYGVLASDAKKALNEGMVRMVSLLARMLAIAEGHS